MYTMYDWEVMADAMEEVNDWEAFEADMATMERPYPSEEDLDAMYEEFCGE